MAYTNVWDSTAPPDTQAANQLGLDLRNLKKDVQERLGTFFSGPLANRPTPEAAWAGLVYFATDSRQIFRWSGAAWVLTPIGGSLVSSDATVYNGIGSFDVNAIAIPANFLSVGQALSIEGSCTSNQGLAASTTVSLVFGATTIVQINPTVSSNLHFRVNIVVTGAATQISSGFVVNATQDSVTQGIALPNPAEDTTGIITVKMKADQTNAGDQAVSRLLVVRL